MNSDDTLPPPKESDHESAEPALSVTEDAAVESDVPAVDVPQAEGGSAEAEQGDPPSEEVSDEDTSSLANIDAQETDTPDAELAELSDTDVSDSEVADTEISETNSAVSDAPDGAVASPVMASPVVAKGAGKAPSSAVSTADDFNLTPFVVELPEFSGPLDLLLTLIREEQLDIYDIPIARIAQQFLARIHDLRLDAAAEYLEMAARLLRIKAQMLLPRPEGVEGWEDPRAELVRRLLEYQQVREVVDVLERLSDERRNRFSRVFVQPPREVPDTPPEEIPLAMSLSELFTAVDRVLRQAKKPTVHDVVPRALDVDGAITAIRSILTLRARARWSDVIERDAEPWQILSVLLALLELAKRGELRIVQPKPFASVEFSGDTASEAA